MRRRLFLVTLAVTTLLVAAFAFPLARLVREVARDRAITDAERDLAALAPVLAVEPERSLLGAAVERTASGQDGRLSVLPLTALRLDAEGHGATALLEDVDRLEAEVTELIAAARRPLHEEVVVRADLAAVASDRAVFWGALADDDGRAWTCSVKPNVPALVRLSESDGAAAIDVLLGNVFAHTPEGTPYEVSVTAGAGRVVLALDDGGPGIDDAAVLLDRGASAAGSTGLGLDIAAATARAAGGELRIKASHLGGARVQLDLPLVDDDR